MLKFIELELRLLLGEIELLVLHRDIRTRGEDGERETMQADKESGHWTITLRAIRGRRPHWQPDLPRSFEDIEWQAFGIQRGRIIVQWPTGIVLRDRGDDLLERLRDLEESVAEVSCQFTGEMRVVYLRDEPEFFCDLPADHADEGTGKSPEGEMAKPIHGILIIAA